MGEAGKRVGAKYGSQTSWAHATPKICGPKRRRIFTVSSYGKQSKKPESVELCNPSLGRPTNGIQQPVLRIAAARFFRELARASEFENSDLSLLYCRIMGWHWRKESLRVGTKYRNCCLPARNRPSNSPGEQEYFFDVHNYSGDSLEVDTRMPACISPPAPLSESAAFP